MFSERIFQTVSLFASRLVLASDGLNVKEIREIEMDFWGILRNTKKEDIEKFSEMIKEKTEKMK